MCWVFEVSPSKLRPIIWDNSLHDIEVRTRLKVGEKQSGFVQDHQTLIEIISQVLGGGSSDSTAGATIPQNANELMSAFNSVFSHG